MMKQFAVLSFSVALLQGCAQPSPENSAQLRQKAGPWISANSAQAFGAQIAGTTIRGIFAGQMTGSPTGYWVRSDYVENYAPVNSIRLNGSVVNTLTAPEGWFKATVGQSVQTLQSSAFELRIDIGAPLNTILRVTGADTSYSYGRYTASWFDNNSDEGTWSPLCPHSYAVSDSETINIDEYLIPVGGARWEIDGSRSPDTNAIQLSCSHDSIGGCVSWGYEPWLKPPGVNMTAIHQACTRMKRADFCGTGDPLTTSNQSDYLHTEIQVWDVSGIHTADTQTADTMEASWDEGGATCVNSDEYRSDLEFYVGHKNAQLKTCAKPACTDSTAGLTASARPCQAWDNNHFCVSN